MNLVNDNIKEMTAGEVALACYLCDNQELAPLLPKRQLSRRAGIPHSAMERIFGQLQKKQFLDDTGNNITGEGVVALDFIMGSWGIDDEKALKMLRGTPTTCPIAVYGWMQEVNLSRFSTGDFANKGISTLKFARVLYNLQLADVIETRGTPRYGKYQEYQMPETYQSLIRSVAK